MCGLPDHCVTRLTAIKRDLGVGLRDVRASRVGARLPARVRIRACQLSIAALRHNTNVTDSKPAGCARPSCSPPVSVSRGRSPTRRLTQAVSTWYARWEHGGAEALRSKGPSGPAPRLSDTQLAPGRTGPAGWRHRPRVHRGAVDPGADRHGDPAPHRVHHPARCGHCCATGWAGRSSGPRVAPPNATRRRSTAGSRTTSRGSSKL
jgi:hypothetical protein